MLYLIFSYGKIIIIITHFPFCVQCTTEYYKIFATFSYYKFNMKFLDVLDERSILKVYLCFLLFGNN